VITDTSRNLIWCKYSTVACLLGNATRNMCGFSDLANSSVGQSLLHSQTQLCALVTSSDVSSSCYNTLAPLISVMCLLLEAQLSLATSQSPSHIATDGQSVSKSWCRITV
jgi:hypothetical protein